MLFSGESNGKNQNQIDWQLCHKRSRSSFKTNKYKDSFTLATDPFRMVNSSKLHFEPVRHEDLNHSFVDRTIREFCEALLEIYPPHRIFN